MTALIHAIFILDSSGTPIYIWKHKNAPQTLFKGRDEALVGSLISALLNFGQETFAAPQRIDFNGYALTFFSGKFGENVFWAVAVSDSSDHRRATTRMLKDLVNALSALLETVAIEEGMVIETERSNIEMDTIISRTIEKHLRSLPSWRSNPIKSLILSLLISILLGAAYYSIFENPLVSLYISAFLNMNPYFLGAFIVISATVIIGIMSGLAASNTLSGFISGYFSSVISYAIVHQITTIINILALAFSFGLLSALIGGIVGYYTDTVKLKYI